ncbi:MAG: hypothetical protein IPK52_15880 [Chloroflexi bacterium]|nr:hypothetical protein [Chloroflexota bacterium]
MSNRPDPDALLAAIQREENRQQRGKLKIFFGMAAGVGKTYAMLQAARERKDEGVDVVVGYIETHKRVDTEEMARGLEVIPRKAPNTAVRYWKKWTLMPVMARASPHWCWWTNSPIPMPPECGTSSAIRT